MKPIALLFAIVASVSVGAAAAKAGTTHHHLHHYVTGLSGGPAFQGGVLAGPLYNGQDYLGTDPDPNIRAYLLRDLDSRYGGGR